MISPSITFSYRGNYVPSQRDFAILIFVPLYMEQRFALRRRPPTLMNDDRSRELQPAILGEREIELVSVRTARI